MFAGRLQSSGLFNKVFKYSVKRVPPAFSKTNPKFEIKHEFKAPNLLCCRSAGPLRSMQKPLTVTLTKRRHSSIVMSMLCFVSAKNLGMTW